MQYSTTQPGNVVFLADGAQYGSVSTGQGTHSFTYMGLTSGNHKLTTNITNSYGNNSDSIDYTVEVITPPDSINITSPTEGETGGINVTVNFDLKGNGMVICKVDTGEQFVMKNLSTGSYSCPTFNNLTEGNRIFTTTFTPSGTGSSISSSVHYNATTANVTIDNPASGTSGGNSLTLTYTINKSSVIQCRDDSGVTYTTGNGPGRYTCTLNNLPVGTHTITVEMSDFKVTDSIIYTVQANQPIADNIRHFTKIVKSILFNFF